MCTDTMNTVVWAEIVDSSSMPPTMITPPDTRKAFHLPYFVIS